MSDKDEEDSEEVHGHPDFPEMDKFFPECCATSRLDDIDMERLSTIYEHLKTLGDMIYATVPSQSENNPVESLSIKLKTSKLSYKIVVDDEGSVINKIIAKTGEMMGKWFADRACRMCEDRIGNEECKKRQKNKNEVPQVIALSMDDLIRALGKIKNPNDLI